MLRVGYDPREMPKVFAMLDRVSQASGAGRVPGWLSTHPDPADREGRIAQRVAALPNQDFSALAVNRDVYLRRIDGMVFGNNPREGYFRGNTFIHPELAFWIDFPDDWRTLNQKQAVLGQAPDQDAMVELTLAEGSDPAAAARAFAAQEGVSAGAPRTGAVNGLTASTVTFTATTEQTSLEGLAMFVRLGDNVFRLLGYAPRSRWASYQGAILESFGTFDRLTDRDALNVQPWHLDVVQSDRSQTLAEFYARQDSPASLDEIALINQMDPQTALQRGQLVKTVVGRPLP
jgi:predicted Zn-dependent protease